MFPISYLVAVQVHRVVKHLPALRFVSGGPGAQAEASQVVGCEKATEIATNQQQEYRVARQRQHADRFAHPPAVVPVLTEIVEEEHSRPKQRENV